MKRVTEQYDSKPSVISGASSSVFPLNAVTPQATPTKRAWTPGPWHVGEISTPPFERGVFGQDEMAVAKIYIPLDFNKKRSEANAKLIAKAPELVEALQALVEVVDGLQSGKIWSRHNSDVNNAFDKAERILREAGAL